MIDANLMIATFQSRRAQPARAAGCKRRDHTDRPRLRQARRAGIVTQFLEHRPVNVMLRSRLVK
jgi:hypothetical protein